MTALSIALPDKLAQASQAAAKRLGVSRTYFIRVAIEHELKALERKEEQDLIARDLIGLQADPAYQQEVQDLESAAYPDLPEDPEGWWKS